MDGCGVGWRAGSGVVIQTFSELLEEGRDLVGEVGEVEGGFVGACAVALEAADTGNGRIQILAQGPWALALLPLLGAYGGAS